MKGLILILAALAVALALAGCGGNDGASSPTATATETTTQTETTQPPTTTDSEEQAPTVVRVTVKEGGPEGGIVRASVNDGDRVVLVVTSDVADEVHLHGYDLSRDVAAGETVRIPFTANVPGRFEVELEQRGLQIADLTVEP